MTLRWTVLANRLLTFVWRVATLHIGMAADDTLFRLCRDGEVAKAREVLASDGFDRGNIDAPIAHFGGHTPLTAACWFGHLPVVRFLVHEAGASVQQATADDGQTPLHVTATCVCQRLSVHLRACRVRASCVYVCMHDCVCVDAYLLAYAFVLQLKVGVISPRV